MDAVKLVSKGNDSQMVILLRQRLHEAQNGEISGIVMVTEFANGVVPDCEVVGEFDADNRFNVMGRLGEGYDQIKAIDCRIHDFEEME